MNRKKFILSDEAFANVNPDISIDRNVLRGWKQAIKNNQNVLANFYMGYILDVLIEEIDDDEDFEPEASAPSLTAKKAAAKKSAAKSKSATATAASTEGESEADGSSS